MGRAPRYGPATRSQQPEQGTAQVRRFTTHKSLRPRVSWEESDVAGVCAAPAAKLGHLDLVRRRRGAGRVIRKEAVRGRCLRLVTTQRGRRCTMLVQSCLCSVITAIQTSAHRTTHPMTGCCRDPCGDRAGVWPGCRPPSAWLWSSVDEMQSHATLTASRRRTDQSEAR